MRSANEFAASNQSHDQWLPMLDLAAREVFEIMLGSSLTPVPADAPDPALEITGMVGLAGMFCGVLTVRCSAEAAARMASKMLGVEADKAGPDMWDAIGEVCNMIAGNFKNKITGLSDGCMLSVPTVITGADYSLHALADAGAYEVRALFDGMPLTISLEIHS